ncbi:MAG: hypothetical protein AB1498_05280 [bacterium]
MPIISKNEKIELIKSVKSDSLRKDMEYLSRHKHNPVVVKGRINMDNLIVFLNEYNEFINHRPKPFRKIIDKNMKI